MALPLPDSFDGVAGAGTRKPERFLAGCMGAGYLGGAYSGTASIMPGGARSDVGEQPAPSPPTSLSQSRVYFRHPWYSTETTSFEYLIKVFRAPNHIIMGKPDYPFDMGGTYDSGRDHVGPETEGSLDTKNRRGDLAAGKCEEGCSVL